MNRQIIEEAADWFVELSSGEVDREAKEAFDRWLRKSPEHVRVYLELLPIWDDAATALPEDRTTVDELVALARESENVVEFQRLAPPGISGVHEASVRSFAAHRVSIAATFVLVVLLGAFGAWFGMFRDPVYATTIGEQRTIRLSDGSTVEINTRSKVRVKFSERERHVELLEGQALFTVAKDSQRPFTVGSGGSHVRALGTVFDVYRKTKDTIVTVVEGRVSVNPERLANKEDQTRPALLPSSDDTRPEEERHDLVLSAGEQIILSAVAPTIAPRRADITIATAWTQGRLIFEATPLPEVAAEFNRYNDRRIVVDDSALKDFRVNGSFGSTDPSSLLRFLEAQGIVVHETDSTIHIARR